MEKSPSLNGVIEFSPYEVVFKENNRILLIGDYQDQWKEDLQNLAGEYALDIYFSINATEGLKLVEEHGPFAVNVIPYAMPDISSKEFYSIIRKRFSESYIVIITDIVNADEARSFFKIDSFAACMIKPIRIENFSMMIKKLMTKYNLVKREHLTIKRLKEKEIDMEIISVITKNIVSSLNFSKIIRIVLDEIQNKLPVDKCIYFAITPENLLVHIESRGIPEHLLKKIPTMNIDDYDVLKYICSEKKEIYIGDLNNYPDETIKRIASSAGINSIAIFPVILEGRVAGLLSISTENREEERRITPRVFTVLKRITELLSISLWNATKYKNVSDFNRELLNELKKTSQLGNKICSTLELNELLKVSIEGINEILPCEAHTLLIMDRETGKLNLRFGTGGGINKLLEYKDHEDIEIADFVLSQKQPLIKNGMKASEDVPVNVNIREELMKYFPPVSNIMIVPVISKGESIGLIISMDKKDGTDFDETDAEHISIIASQIGIATENAILSQEKTRNLERTFIKLEQTEAQLFQSEKMAALGHLAGGVAHEINNPLTGIVTNLEHINELYHLDEAAYGQFMELCSASAANANSLDELKAKLTKLFESEKKRTRWLSTAVKGGLRCKHIVENLLTFSRQSRIEDYNYFDLNECITQTIELVHHQFEVKGVTIEKNMPSSELNVYGNMGEISQVFLNMLINAFQAIKGGGKITVTTNEPVDGFVELLISDTGSGISEEIRDRIFDPFFTTKEVGVGTGLGLSIAHGIIEKHGGLIDFRSNSGKGTTFSIKLPTDENGNKAKKETDTAFKAG
ncbi:MAG: GAF domain-containing protein [Candidatus Schekmanbacteria bacterium]|nr:GAF domain-containing protein [Candidatus Schekmanbacteria bacterium]